MQAEQVKTRIEQALPGAQVTVVDLTGTSDHFQATVVSDRFAGQPLVRQHQVVYACLQDVLDTGELHALALKTYTPEQWSRLQPPG